MVSGLEMEGDGMLGHASSLHPKGEFSKPSRSVCQVRPQQEAPCRPAWFFPYTRWNQSSSFVTKGNGVKPTDALNLVWKFGSDETRCLPDPTSQMTGAELRHGCLCSRILQDEHHTEAAAAKVSEWEQKLTLDHVKKTFLFQYKITGKYVCIIASFPRACYPHNQRRITMDVVAWSNTVLFLYEWGT